MRIPLTYPDAKNERGAVAIMVSVLTVVIMILAAFSVDLGLAYSTKRQLATAADAASLAAVSVYKKDFVGSCSAAALASQSTVRTAAEAAADSVYVANYTSGTTASGDITAVQCKGVGVEVVYRATGSSGSPFGVLAGGTGAIATKGSAAATYALVGKCSMCFLGPVDAGNADFSVFGGDIHVNGSITAGPNSEWDADNSISVVGTVNGGQFAPPATQGVIIPDPFASMVLPLSEAGLTAKTNPCTQGPGVYGGNFEVPNSGTCTLAPGAYVIKGTWSAKNNSLIKGSGVTLYVKKTGMIDFKNGATQDLSAPTTGPPAGSPAGWPTNFVIIYDRDNTNDLSIQGNGNVTLGGIVYVPSSKIDFNGNSCLAINKGAIVATGVVKANGQKACIEVTDALLAGQGVPGNLVLSK
ncbi:pilus assembly protein TadG-related protein [Nocardioides lacusdianchii]|uniref:pilus assembly protein TadG-related protein n=1 Tax=Nocardioides lacusdianchii TaxID=2783664 RepID=UPI001CC9A166|nr:pilus assembly protein TadG-related protein [Nocardioides lacusdianchii]